MQTPNQFFPKQLNVEQIFGEFTVTVINERNLSHVIERKIKVVSGEANEIREIFVLQAKGWPAK